MKKNILLVIMYIISILLLFDIRNYALFPEEYLFGSDISDLMFTIYLVLYFFIVVLIIFSINMYLIKRNSNNTPIWFKCVSVLFLPIFIGLLYEFNFSMLGFVEVPQVEFGMFARGGLLFIIVGLLLFGIGYFKIINERDRKINNYIYLILNILSFSILFLSLIYQ